MARNYGAKQVLHDLINEGRWQYSDDLAGYMEFVADLSDILSIELDFLKDRFLKGKV